MLSERVMTHDDIRSSCGAITSAVVQAMGVNLLQSIRHFSSNSHPRVQVSLRGRYMLKSNEEYPCHTFEMSVGDISIFAPVKAMPGEKVVLYLNELGRFVGTATEATECGFEMMFNLSPKKRDRLADQLTWFANRFALELADQRRHERFTPLMELAVLRLSAYEEHIVRIQSLSLSGAAILTDERPDVGVRVLIGRTPATVVRHFGDGIACEFVRHFRPGEIDETTRL